MRRAGEMTKVEPFERIDRIEIGDRGSGAGRCPDDEGVAAGSAGERIAALARIDRVAAGTAGYRVVATLAVETIVAVAAD